MLICETIVSALLCYETWTRPVEMVRHDVCDVSVHSKARQARVARLLRSVVCNVKTDVCVKHG